MLTRAAAARPRRVPDGARRPAVQTGEEPFGESNRAMTPVTRECESRRAPVDSAGLFEGHAIRRHANDHRAARSTAIAAGVASRVRGEDKKSGKQASWDSIVVGAGVFGAWTAWHLRKAGQRVLLLDAFGAAHARASSGGESRMTRGSYGGDEVYTRMAFDSLAQWKWLSDLVGPAGLASHRRRVLLPEARALCRPVARGASAPQTADAGARSRRARAALSAGELEGHRSRRCSSPTSACSWRAAPCRRW